MKRLLTILVLNAAIVQTFFAQCPSGQTFTHTTNFQSLGQTESIPLENIECDDANKSGGIKFKAAFNIEDANKTGELFSLSTNDGVILLKVKIINNQIVINRRVQLALCNSWNDSGCQTFDPNMSFGNMVYKVWDDDFIEDNDGWIQFHFADNGFLVRASESQIGPYKSDLDFNGLHESGIERLVDEEINAGDTYLTYSIPSRDASGIHLTNITLDVGQIDYVTGVTIDDGSKSPETNYPQGTGTSQVAPDFPSDITTIEKENDQLFQLYPNPAKDKVTLTLPEREGQAGIYFFSQNGQLAAYYEIDETSLSEASISTTNYSRGFYIVRVIADGKVYQKKLILE